jgi:hypothetical protein
MATLKPSQRLFFLNPPFSSKGLYLFNTAIMFRAMCEPPVANVAYSDRILLPSRWFNANYDQFSLARLKALTDDPNVKAVLWNEKAARLEPLDMHIGSGSQTISLTPSFKERNQYGQFSRLKFFLDPAVLNSEVNFIELDLSCKATAKAPKALPAVSVHWQTEDVPQFTTENMACFPVTADGITRHYQFPVSNTMRWWLQKKNGCFEIRLPSPGFENEVSNIQSIGWKLMAPAATVTNAPPDGDGVHNVEPASPVSLKYDASEVRNAKSILVEVSRPDSLLEEGVVTGRRNYDRKGKAMIRRELTNLADSISFTPSEIPKPGVYEIEVGTVDAQGKLGYFSDPLFVRIQNRGGERSI